MLFSRSSFLPLSVQSPGSHNCAFRISEP
jgi:hypothetical protein